MKNTWISAILKWRVIVRDDFFYLDETPDIIRDVLVEDSCTNNKLTIMLASLNKLKLKMAKIENDWLSIF